MSIDEDLKNLLKNKENAINYLDQAATEAIENNSMEIFIMALRQIIDYTDEESVSIISDFINLVFD